MDKIGLYFGSFNPIHKGHMMVAEHCLKKLKFKEVWFIISPHNPLKDSRILIDEQHRLRMVTLATYKDMGLYTNDVEFNMPRPSYTIDTLRELKEEPLNKDADFQLILGQDNIESIEKWKDYQEILDNYQIWVYPRTPDEHKLSNGLILKENVHFLDAERSDMSSTEIRDRIKQGKSVSEYLPHAFVEKYIKENKLYE